MIIDSAIILYIIMPPTSVQLFTNYIQVLLQLLSQMCRYFRNGDDLKKKTITINRNGS